MGFPAFYEGKLLFKDGSLADSSCCCDGPLCCLSIESFLSILGAVSVDILLDEDTPVTPAWSSFTFTHSATGSITLTTNTGSGNVSIEVGAACYNATDVVVGVRLSYYKGSEFPATRTFNSIYAADSGLCDDEWCFAISLNLNTEFAMDPGDDYAFTNPNITLDFTC